MAFTLAAIVGSTTVTLSNANPFFLRHAKGMSGAAIRRVTAQGPAQNGDTDMGYRLAPREMELSIGFKAATDAALDAHRDTLMSIFKPLAATPINLRLTRDDGEIRQLDCNLVGKLDIKLAKEHRPGHYHEATVRLRASNPEWYELAPGTVTVAGTPSLETQWYLAGGAIGTVAVLMSGSVPAQGEAWSYTGTIPASTSWTVAFRSALEPLAGTARFAFYVDNDTGGAGVLDVAVGAVHIYNAGGSTPYELHSTFMSAGTANYFVLHSPNYFMFNGFELNVHELYVRGNGANLEHNMASYSGTHTLPISGTARRWRSDPANTASSRWASPIPLYALYSPGLSESQLSALSLYMDGAVGGTIASVLAVPYEGDLPEYPVISLRGPIASPSIVNTVTGHTLDFGTVSIGAGTTYIIDTRYGYKTVLAGTVSHRSELTADSDLGEFHLAPDPIATGGTNTLAVHGSGISAATQFSVVYYNRFQSF